MADALVFARYWSLERRRYCAPGERLTIHADRNASAIRNVPRRGVILVSVRIARAKPPEIWTMPARAGPPALAVGRTPACHICNGDCNSRVSAITLPTAGIQDLGPCRSAGTEAYGEESGATGTALSGLFRVPLAGRGDRRPDWTARVGRRCQCREWWQRQTLLHFAWADACPSHLPGAVEPACVGRTRGPLRACRDAGRGQRCPSAVELAVYRDRLYALTASGPSVRRSLESRAQTSR